MATEALYRSRMGIRVQAHIEAPLQSFNGHLRKMDSISCERMKGKIREELDTLVHFFEPMIYTSTKMHKSNYDLEIYNKSTVILF